MMVPNTAHLLPVMNVLSFMKGNIDYKEDISADGRSEKECTSYTRSSYLQIAHWLDGEEKNKEQEEE